MTVAETVAEKEPVDVRPTLILFTAATSGPARRVEGFVAQVLQRRSNHSTFRLVTVDVEARPKDAERFKIDAIPTLVLVDGRKIVARIEQPTGAAAIRAALADWLR